MKRNMDLVRKILLEINNYEHGYAPEHFNIEGFSKEEIGYHCLILHEAGLIKAIDASYQGDLSPSAIPERLTWEGHEFIENAQNEKVWNQTKEVVSKLGDVSFSVWASILSRIVMSNLGF